MTQNSLFEVAGNGPATASEQPAGSAEGAEAVPAVSEGSPDWLSELLGDSAAAGPAWPRTIDDVEKALQWAGEAERELAEVQAMVDAHLEAVKARAAAMTAAPSRRLTGLLERVEAWAVANRGEVVRGKAKSRQLLTGSIGFRAVPEKVLVLDEVAFLAWAQAERLDLVVLKPSIDKKALNAFVTQTGELPPGIDVKPATEAVTVKALSLPTLPAAKASKELP